MESSCKLSLLAANGGWDVEHTLRLEGHCAVVVVEARDEGECPLQVKRSDAAGSRHHVEEDVEKVDAVLGCEAVS